MKRIICLSFILLGVSSCFHNSEMEMKKYSSLLLKGFDLSVRKCGELPVLENLELRSRCSYTNDVLKEVNEYSGKEDLLKKIGLKRDNLYFIQSKSFGVQLNHYKVEKNKLIKVFSSINEDENYDYCLEYKNGCLKFLTRYYDQQRSEEDIKHILHLIRNCTQEEELELTVSEGGKGNNFKCGKTAFQIRKENNRSISLNSKELIYLIFDVDKDLYLLRDFKILNDRQIKITKESFNKFEIIRYCYKTKQQACYMNSYLGGLLNNKVPYSRPQRVKESIY